MIPYDFTKHAAKAFLKLPPNTQKKIISKLEYYLSSANPLAFAKRLTGIVQPVFRFRVDDYRVIFDWHEDNILILKVGHRSEIYRD